MRPNKKSMDPVGSPRPVCRTAAWRTRSSLWDAGEVCGDLLPVVEARKTRGAEIVRSGIEQALAFEPRQVAGQVVDQIVGAENGLAAAKHIMLRRNEGKVALQPAVLGSQRVGDNHGLRGDKDFKARREILQHLLRAGNQRQVFKKIFGIEKGAKLLLAVGRSEFPNSLAC